MNFRFSPPLRGVIAKVGSVFGIGKDTEDGKPAIAYDDDGSPLFKEDIIKKVMEDLTMRKQERGMLEMQWTLNANFLTGNQYCEINTYRGEIEQLEPVYPYLERETYNQISPLIETRVANLKKISYSMKVKPATNELKDYAKADISTSVLNQLQKISDFETKKNTAIYWNELCGNCFWLSWWDNSKGEFVGKTGIEGVDSEGKPFKYEQTYFEGDIDYGLITPYEIYPESMFKQTVEAQRSIILEQVKTADEVYDLYGVEVDGEEVQTFSLTPMASGGGFGYESTVMGIDTHTVKNGVKVVTMFERASKKHPEGRLIIIVGEDNLVYYGPLPYGEIPIVQMICREVPGQFFGKSTIEDLIPRQRSYNACKNRIHEYIRRIAIGNLSVEEGSVDVELLEEEGLVPGKPLIYKNGYNEPKPIMQGNLPGELLQELYNLKSDMEYIAGTSQLMVNGATPAGVTSGTAIQSLMEIDNTRLSLTGDYVRNSVRKLAQQWLGIYKRYASTKRIINFVGLNNIGKVIMWSKEDINSYDVEYIAENELLTSEEMQRQAFFELYNMGIFTDENGTIPTRVKLQAMEHMKMGAYSELMNMNMLHLQKAQSENAFFESGSIPEVDAFDEHEVHIEEHMRYVLQMEFQLLKLRKPEYAKALEQHIEQHKTVIEQKKQEEQIKALQMMQGMG